LATFGTARLLKVIVRSEMETLHEEMVVWSLGKKENIPGKGSIADAQSWPGSAGQHRSGSQGFSFTLRAS
jgi:hypothetical protein